MFERLQIEEWFDKYQYKVECNIGESGIKSQTMNDLGIDLGNIVLRYGHHSGAPELREMIARDYPGLSKDNIAVTTGAAEAIFAIVASLVGPNDQVLVEHPNFPSLYMIPTSLERDVQLYKLSFEEKFKLDFEKLKRQIGPRTKLVMLCRPNNPTGAVISTNELEKVIEIIEASNAYLLVDETYRELHFGVPSVPAASLSPKVISVSTMSKAYGVPGIRIGWVAAAPNIIDFVRVVREQVTICNSIIGEKIAFEILRRKETLLPKWRQLLIDNLTYLKSWINDRTDLEWVIPQAGVVGFPKLIGNVTSLSLCTLLAEKYKTFVVPGNCFQMPDYFRIGYGIEAQDLQEGLKRLGQALTEVKNTVE